MKRKTQKDDDPTNGNGAPDTKRRVLSDEVVAGRFREGLFEPSELEKYTKNYAGSAP